MVVVLACEAKEWAGAEGEMRWYDKPYRCSKERIELTGRSFEAWDKRDLVTNTIDIERSSDMANHIGF